MLCGKEPWTRCGAQRDPASLNRAGSEDDGIARALPRALHHSCVPHNGLCAQIKMRVAQER